MPPFPSELSFLIPERVSIYRDVMRPVKQSIIHSALLNYYEDYATAIVIDSARPLSKGLCAVSLVPSDGVRFMINWFSLAYTSLQPKTQCQRSFPEITVGPVVTEYRYILSPLWLFVPLSYGGE